MDHVLTVGEIYDKAVDLCLRNAGSIALTLGIFFLLFSTLAVLNTTFVGFGIFAAMHVHPRDAILPSPWITVLIYAVRFTALPMIAAALFVLFDRTLRGQPVVLKDCFRSSIRRIANVISAAFVCSLIGYLTLITIVIVYAALFQILKLPTITVVVVLVLAAVVISMVSFLMLGSAIGLARVALDAGRVLPSMRVGFAAAFSKVDRGHTVGVAIPLLALLVFGAVGFVFAGIEAFALTGTDAANIIIRSVGDTIVWSMWIAVATVYYRNLVPVGRPQR